MQPARRPKRAREEEAGPRRQSARLSRRGAAVDVNETPAKKRKREVRVWAVSPSGPSSPPLPFPLLLLLSLPSRPCSCERGTGRICADASVLFLPGRLANSQQEEEAQRKRDEEGRLAAEERARAARMSRHHDLTLEDLANKAEWEQGVFTGLAAEFEALVRTPHARRAAAQDAFVYDADDKAEAREVAALQKRVGRLTVAARAKVTQDRVYSAAYHPDRSKDLIFFGGERVYRRLDCLDAL